MGWMVWGFCYLFTWSQVREDWYLLNSEFLIMKPLIINLRYSKIPSFYYKSFINVLKRKSLNDHHDFQSIKL